MVRFVIGALAFGACVRPALGSAPPTAAVGASAPVATARFASPYTYEWFVRAELLRAGGQLAVAIEAYRTALAGADEDAHVLARLASALDEQGDHDQAAELVDQALRLEPDCEAAWLARAELALRKPDLAAALAALERAEQSQPLSPRGPLALAALLRAHGNPERAAAVLLRYEARSLPGTRAAQQARLARALAARDADQVFAATLPYRLLAPADSAALFDAARSLLEQGRAAQALRVIELVPETPGESGLRLRILLACARWSAAEGWLANHELDGPDARLELARAQLALRRPELAAESLEAERLERADEPSLQLIAAQIELARGAYASAALQFARIPRGSTTQPAAQLGLAQALTAQALPELAAEVSSQHRLREATPAAAQ
jgi:predicted Zn-dependent protease